MEIIAHSATAGRSIETTDRGALVDALRGPAGRVELDVCAFHGRLVIAHHPRDAGRPGRLSLEAALELIEPSGRGLLADIKGAGVARALADALIAHRLAGRAIVCGELDQIELACRASGATAAWTLPTPAGRPLAVRLPSSLRLPGPQALLARVLARPGPSPAPRPPRPARKTQIPRTTWQAPAGPFGCAGAPARRRVQQAAVDGLAQARCAAVAVDRRFVTPSLVAAVHAHGGRLLAWTVDDPTDARRLARLGVDGLITNDPRRVAAAVS
jgi:glycerophosphoryl diester phosphodiesterase family protein